jgi:hypothetical protein
VASQTPPFLGNNALQGIPREANVVVPEIGFGAYKVAPQWKEFFNMNTELNKTFQTEITISSVNGKLQLSHLPLNAIVRVYTITGAKLLEMNCVSASETIELSKGVYVVQVNVQRFKTIIQ